MDDRFDRALHVGLDDQRHFRDRRGMVGEHVLEADRRRGGPLPVEHALAIARDFAGARFVLDDRERIAGRRHRRQAEHLDRNRRPGFLHLAAVVVDQRANLAARRARDEHVADAKRAALDEHGRKRAAALVELGLDHRAFGGAVGVGLELEDFGLELDRFEQLVEVGLLLGRDFDVLDVAAHVLDDDLVLEKLLADLLRLGLGLIDLVDRDDHRHAGRLGVVDRLDRLRAQAVVGRDHQDHDVGDVGAARAHLRESLVARRVEEGDLRLVGQADLIGADVLGDAAGFAATRRRRRGSRRAARSCRGRRGP